MTHNEYDATYIAYNEKLPAEFSEMYHSQRNNRRTPRGIHSGTLKSKFYLDFLNHKSLDNYIQPDFENITFDTLFAVNREPFVKAHPEIEHWVDTGQPPCMVNYTIKNDLDTMSNMRDDFKCADRSCTKLLVQRDCLKSSSNINNKIKSSKICSETSSSSGTNDSHELKKLIPKVLRKSMEFYDEFPRNNMNSPENGDNCEACVTHSSPRKEPKKRLKKNVCQIFRDKDCDPPESREQYKILRKYHKKIGQKNNECSQYNSSSCGTIVLEVKKVKHRVRRRNNLQGDSYILTHDLGGKIMSKTNLRNLSRQMLSPEKLLARDQSPTSKKSSCCSDLFPQKNEALMREKLNTTSQYRNSQRALTQNDYGSESSVLTANYIKSIQTKMNSRKKAQPVLKKKHECRVPKNISNESCDKQRTSTTNHNESFA